MRLRTLLLIVLLALPALTHASEPNQGLVKLNHDISSELRLPLLGSPEKARLLRRTSERALINLVGPNASNLKLRVRVASKQVQWETIADFRIDFARDNGILYVFDAPSTPVFSTHLAYTGLDVLFFDADGRFISSAEMDRCYGNSCPAYIPLSPASYALEVTKGFARKHHISSLWRLPVDRYTLTEREQMRAPAVIDRAAIRRQRALNIVRVPLARVALSDVHGTLADLARSVASTIRIADLRSTQGTQILADDARKNLYSTLRIAGLKHPELLYLFLVRPEPMSPVMSLIVDNYSLLGPEMLDMNANGKIDEEEKPTEIGARYSYEPLTRALTEMVIDTQLNSGTGIYTPIRDPDGIVIAILGIVTGQ